MVSTPLRVLITGSRAWTDERTLTSALAARANAAGPTGMVVVHGGCPTGADDLADRWVTRNRHLFPGLTVERHPAQWTAEGRAAGPLRNTRMVALGADVCLAFPLNASIGTRDCMRKAMAAGIKVVDHEPKPDDTLSLFDL